MPDVVAPLNVTNLDRADLIARIRELERQRSAWEARIRACQERESLYLSFVSDIGEMLGSTFEHAHVAVSAKAAQAQELLEQIRVIVRSVEEL